MRGPKQHPDTAKALQLIANGLSVAKAAALYKLHPTTLWKAIRKGKIPSAKVVDTLPENS
jgi:hypothetical protein